MPPPSTISATSATAAIGTMCCGDPPRLLVHDGPRELVAGARRAEDRARVVGRRERRAQAAARRELRARSRRRRWRPGRSRARGRRRARSRPRPRRRGGRGAARRAARARRRGRCRPTGRRSRRRPGPTPRQCSPTAARLTSFSTRHGHAEPLLEHRADRQALEPRDVARRGRRCRSGASITPGTPATAPSSASAGSPHGGDQPVAQLGGRVEHGVHVGARHLDVLARAHRRRAGRRSRRAGSARRGRARARAPPRAPARRTSRRTSARRRGCRPRARARASSSDSSATDTVGLEIPTRREISAREIGAPARMASSTVRSLRSRSSVGVAGARRRAHLVNDPNEGSGRDPLAAGRVEQVRLVLRARPQVHALAARRRVSRVDPRDEPRRAVRRARAVQKMNASEPSSSTTSTRRRRRRRAASSSASGRTPTITPGRPLDAAAPRAAAGSSVVRHRTRPSRRRRAAPGTGSWPASRRSRRRTC